MTVPELQNLKREHDAIRAYINQVKECLRQADAIPLDAPETQLKFMKDKAFNLYNMLWYLESGAEKHDEREENILSSHTDANVVRIIKSQHDDIKRELTQATECMAHCLHEKATGTQFKESVLAAKKILTPLLEMWQEHISTVNLIVDTLSSDTARKEEAPHSR
ncbi:MAG: hypothetical protein HYX80_07245 [Chloroflexi bacterium]|nr:hypothetical protein [Chloroflexota bacterium]